MKNSIKVKRGAHNYSIHQPKIINYSSRDTGNNTTRMVFDSELAFKLHAELSNRARLGLAQIETPDKTKSPWGGRRVLDLLTTKP